MKTLLLSLLLIAPVSYSQDFRAGGELVNPRSTPHVVPQANVTVSVPDSWSVEASSSELSASQFALKGARQAHSQINVVTGIDASDTSKAECQTSKHAKFSKRICYYNESEGVVFIEGSKDARATLTFLEGTQSELSADMDAIIKSFQHLN